MFELPSTALQWLGAGLALSIAGALIKFHGWTFLMSGYDEMSPVPDEVVADVAGNTVLRIGLAAIALGVLIVVGIVASVFNLVPFGFVLAIPVNFYGALVAFNLYGRGVEAATDVESGPDSPEGRPAV